MKTVQKMHPDIEIPVSTQSEMWRSFLRSGKEMVKKLTEYLNSDQFCLHFDEKMIEKHEG